MRLIKFLHSPIRRRLHRAPRFLFSIINSFVAVGRLHWSPAHRSKEIFDKNVKQRRTVARTNFIANITLNSIELIWFCSADALHSSLALLFSSTFLRMKRCHLGKNIKTNKANGCYNTRRSSVCVRVWFSESYDIVKLIEQIYFSHLGGLR